ncbi:MAG TPA: UPF0182 family protein, partial [Dehalococcoidia bacterium]|nr:UPF0182 family protein [Dehalococcoidia bacterium]
MSFQFPPRRDYEDLGPPPPPFRIRRSRVQVRGFGGFNRWIIAGVLLVLAYVVLNTAKSVYVDWLWFESVGYRSVYAKIITAQAVLFVSGAAFFLLYFGGSTFIAARPLLRTPAPGLSASEAAGLRRVYLLGLIAGSVFLALIFGSIAANRWDSVLAYLEATPFGIADPQSGRDVGFYVLKLPALRFLYGWLMGVAVLSVLAAAALYLMRFILLGVDREGAKGSRIHLALLLLAVVGL